MARLGHDGAPASPTGPSCSTRYAERHGRRPGEHRLLRRLRASGSWPASSRACTPATSAGALGGGRDPSEHDAFKVQVDARPAARAAATRRTAVTDAYDLHEEPELDRSRARRRCSTGWIDAGGAAQLAMSTLEDECEPGPIATFDPDTFIDFRARRPVMELRDGVNTQPGLADHRAQGRPRRRRPRRAPPLRPRARLARGAASPTRPPSLSLDLGAHIMVGLGAYPFADAPHPAEPPLGHRRFGRGGGRAALPEELGRRPRRRPGRARARLRRPRRARRRAVGPGAPLRVPRRAYPPASVALLGGLSEVAGLRVDATVLRDGGRAPHRSRLDELIASNPEHVEVLRQLEQAYDEEDESAARPVPCRSPPATFRAATSWPPSWSGSCGTRAAEVRRLGPRRRRAALGGVRVSQYGQVSPSWPSRGPPAQAGQQQRLDHHVAGEPPAAPPPGGPRWRAARCRPGPPAGSGPASRPGPGSGSGRRARAWSCRARVTPTELNESWMSSVPPGATLAPQRAMSSRAGPKRWAPSM